MRAPRFIEAMAGRFLVIDGPDGVGKTTQLNLLEQTLIDHGLDVVRAIDPGGTPAGQKIRGILLDSDLELDPMCETMLFMASRAQLVSEVIRPAMEAGKVVLCDRFISATIAYQGASGVDAGLILRLGELASNHLWPDVTIVLNLPAKTGLSRLGSHRDRMERRPTEYHQRVQKEFQNLRKVYPSPVMYADAAGTPEQVTLRIQDLLNIRFAED